MRAGAAPRRDVAAAQGHPGGETAPHRLRRLDRMRIGKADVRGADLPEQGLTLRGAIRR